MDTQNSTVRHPEPGLPRSVRSVLVADIVESTRLFNEMEPATLERWLRLVKMFDTGILPAFQGRLVRSTGDGILAEFDSPRSAIACAFAMHETCRNDNAGRPADQHILLRVGIDRGEVLIVEYDMFGRTVALATRLCGLAGPGETTVSARIRDQLTPVLDADVEDLGDCYLKHLEAPIRTYRVGPPGARMLLSGDMLPRDLRSTIAIVPFSERSPSPDHHWTGEALAEEIIVGLSRSTDLNVISRLSTAPFKGRGLITGDISAHLEADYVLSGTFRVNGNNLAVTAGLAEGWTGRVVWAGSLRGRVSALVRGDSEIVARILSEVRRAMTVAELERVRSVALPNIRSYSLMMAAIALMHRMSLRDFEEARHLLETVLERARRQALPQAWLAQWYVLRVQQGWSSDPHQDALRALECSKQALDADPDCSLALAVDGLVQTHFLKRLDLAQERYQRAVERNPNDALAWLLKGTMHAFMGQGRPAVDNTNRALRLSPLDPHLYYYRSLSGTARLAAGDYAGALRNARASLRENRTHTSTWRVSTIALWRLGRHDEARSAARTLLTMEPDLTISRYLARSPAAPFSTGKDWSEALREAGVPEN